MKKKGIRASETVDPKDYDEEGKLLVWECPICGDTKFKDQWYSPPLTMDTVLGGPDDSELMGFYCNRCTVKFQNPYVFNKRSTALKKTKIIKKWKAEN